MSSFLSARIWPRNARRELKQFVRAVSWPAKAKRLTLAPIAV